VLQSGRFLPVSPEANTFNLFVRTISEKEKGFFYLNIEYMKVYEEKRFLKILTPLELSITKTHTDRFCL